MQTIFYGDSELVFSAAGEQRPPGFTAVTYGGDSAKMIENLEKYKRVWALSPDPSKACGDFVANFMPVEAAGGVVENGRGELLMIRRNGRWDLPKGHRENGEQFAECALREVWEETGVEAQLRAAEPVHTTMHFYRGKVGWEMKTTLWFGMRSDTAAMHPQREEGIESVEWVPRGEVAARAADCFPSVREVLRAAKWI
ncbi:MAG: NUDIX domain-containing protein [Rikenellaceae bacterium]|nr:NUDIX domain-containing protein [Rikenellaceae bacterium]